MKKYILLTLSGWLMFAACSEDVLDPVLSLNSSPTITAPTADFTYNIPSNSPEGLVPAITWTAADFGYQAAINYKVQIDVPGNDFAEAVTIGQSNGLEVSDLINAKLNSILLAKDFSADVPSQLEMQVCAEVSDKVDVMCSQSVTFEVTPFQADIDYPKLQVPGSYQGWAPEKEETVIFSLQSDENYAGYIWFGEDGALYKFTRGTTWDENWGDGDADGVLEPGGIGNDIPISSTMGMYYLTCDLNGLTHTNEKTNWGIIGDATPTGWDSDTDLDWDADRMVLTTTMDLSEGVIKFRANDDWAINLGDNGGNGSMEQDGDDITIMEAGNYTIDLVLMTVPIPTYVITKN